MFADAISINAQNGSTINLINGSSATTNMDKLVIATGDNVNLQIDWKDVFDSKSANIGGNLSLTKVDLTSTDGIGENYQLTNNLKDKLSLDNNIQLAANEDSNNFVAYDSSTGALYSGKETLASAISTRNETSRVYQMVKDEDVSSELGTMAGNNAVLIVNGAENLKMIYLQLMKAQLIYLM